MKKIVVLIIIVIVLAAGYYLLSPLFIQVEVDEALPEDIITAEPETGTVPSGAEKLTEAQKREMAEEMAELNADLADKMSDPMPSPEPPAAAKSFPVMGTTGHPASGAVKVLETESGPVIRYENFSTINGPALHIYLANDLGASDYVDLGEIKGTRGNINYPVPAGVDPDDYRYVMYWCVPFKVLFNYAEIN
jgi:hypothetical protein